MECLTVKKMKKAILFPVTGYHGPEYFCDREEELKALLNNASSGQSTTIMSIRRMGKTGLIQHFFYTLDQDYKGIYLDILHTESLSDFLNILATAIIKAIPQKSSVGKKIWSFIQSIRPNLSFDQLSGNMKVSFDISRTEDVKTEISSLFSLLEDQEFTSIIAIDEFQQILSYSEKNCEAWLRTIVQSLKNVVFIFSGSEYHVMNQLFTNPQKPFFRSTSIMELKPIEKSVYARFIVEKFTSRKRKINNEVATEILDWNLTHTFYVQQLCSRIYMADHPAVTTEVWKSEAEKLLKEQDAIFYNIRELLTPAQWKLLKAVASETRIYAVTSKDFIGRYQLESSAAVLRSLKSLMKKEMICSLWDEDGKRYYRLYDVQLMRWIQHLGM